MGIAKGWAWHFLRSPSDVPVLCPDRIFPTQYTHLVWTRRLRHNQKGSRRQGSRVGIILYWARCETSGTTRSDGAGTASGSTTSGVPAGY